MIESLSLTNNQVLIFTVQLDFSLFDTQFGSNMVIEGNVTFGTPRGGGEGND